MSENTSDPQPALIVDGLSKSFREHQAVDQLSFEVAKGEILGLLGPNGAGKTTTLRTIAGVIPIQSGSVRVAGFDINSEAGRAKECLAWMPDDPQPFDSLTVEEQLLFTARLYAIDDWEAKAERLLVMLDLVDKRKALGGELSRGMRQKLAICCAWLSEPRVALLDEPLSGLDPRGIRAARDAIRVLAQSGCCVVLSSHLLELVGALADRILIMDHGKGVFCGTPEEARSKLALAEGGSLEEVFLAATSTNGSTSEAFEQASNDAAAEMGEVPPATLRPEPSEPTETR